MDKYNYKGDKGEEILRTTVSKLMNLRLEDGENPNTLFFEGDNLREEVQRHG